MAQPQFAYQQPQGAPEMHQQAVYGQPPPQQQQYQQQPMQIQLIVQNTNDSQYKTAVPIPNLGMGSAPVDCPSCGKRCMTRLEYVVGNTTQYAAYVPLYFSN
jgi:hypothetical protein